MENGLGINTAGVLQLELYSLLLISEPETKNEIARVEEVCCIGLWFQKLHDRGALSGGSFGLRCALQLD